MIVKGTYLSLFIAAATLMVGCDVNRPPVSEASSVSSPASAPVTEVSKGYWQIDSETNPVTGQVTSSAYLKYQGNGNIIVRRRGAKVECYINTDEFLETTANLDSRRSSVQYRFDNGKVIRQTWTLSDDNEALFYPGNPKAFLTEMLHAKSLSIEYRPADKVPATITFDVTGFPESFIK